MRIDLGGGAYAVQITTPGLGDHSYVVVAGGRSLAIDPQRDIDRFEKVIRDTGAPLTAVAETHIHNDYVTGGHLLAGAFGVRYLLPEATGSRLPHVAVADNACMVINGGWQLRAIATPGHTPHHTAYELVDPTGITVALLTGGSMLVGSVGRTDLVAADLTDGLTREQFRSVRRLAGKRPDPAAVLPTHGAGSFCSASDIAGTTSTVGRERRRNPALTIQDEDEFVRVQLAGFRLYPTYYRHMAAINLAGADGISPDPLTPLDPADLERAVATGAAVIDVRDRESFAASHIPGAINIPFSDSVGVYAGWVLEWNRQVAIVAPDSGEADSVRLQLARIGHDQIVGRLDGGIEAWEAAGKPVAAYAVSTFSQMRPDAGHRVIDVRDPLEAEDGMVAGAENIHMSRVEASLVGAGQTVWLYCASGYRAAVAASIAARAGLAPVLVADDWDNYRGPVATPA